MHTLLGLQFLPLSNLLVVVLVRNMCVFWCTAKEVLAHGG